MTKITFGNLMEIENRLDFSLFVQIFRFASLIVFCSDHRHSELLYPDREIIYSIV